MGLKRRIFVNLCWFTLEDRTTLCTGRGRGVWLARLTPSMSHIWHMTSFTSRHLERNEVTSSCRSRHGNGRRRGKTTQNISLFLHDFKLSYVYLSQFFSMKHKNGFHENNNTWCLPSHSEATSLMATLCIPKQFNINNER